MARSNFHQLWDAAFIFPATPVSAAAPDLTVTLVLAGGSGSYYPGAFIAVSWTVANQGTAASGSFYNRISLSTTPYGTDISLGNYPMASIAAGYSSSDAQVPQIPTSVSYGYYWVTVFCDGFQAITESNEYNNINHATSQIYVGPPPTICYSPSSG